MKWSCLHCKAEIETEADINQKHHCVDCGAAMAPHSVLCMQEGGQQILDFGNRRMWLFYTNCPNAVFCQNHDQYRPSCEELVMTPRCLVATLATVDRMERRIDNLPTKAS